MNRERTVIEFRGSKQKKRDEETEDKNISKQVHGALNNVDVRSYVEKYKALKMEDYKQKIGPLVQHITVSKVSEYDSTLKIWMSCMDRNLEEFPIPQTRESPQDPSKSVNNINKFFGSKLGGKLLAYVNCMGIHYAGN